MSCEYIVHLHFCCCCCWVFFQTHGNCSDGDWLMSLPLTLAPWSTLSTYSWLSSNSSENTESVLRCSSSTSPSSSSSSLSSRFPPPCSSSSLCFSSLSSFSASPISSFKLGSSWPLAGSLVFALDTGVLTGKEWEHLKNTVFDVLRESACYIVIRRVFPWTSNIN